MLSKKNTRFLLVVTNGTTIINTSSFCNTPAVNTKNKLVHDLNNICYLFVYYCYFYFVLVSIPTLLVDTFHIS
jgi:hypothetical protein